MNSESDQLQQRFPAIAGLKLGKRRRIPLIYQASAVDCGAASLAMVLAHFGKSVALEEIRKAIGVGRDGSDALSIIQAGEYFGLRGRGVEVDIDTLRYLNRGAILFWEFQHFVVFDTARRRSVDVVDPSVGRRKVPMDQFRRQFTGMALEFEPGPDFETTPGENRMWRHLRSVLRFTGLLPRILVPSFLLQLFGLAVPILTGLLVDQVVPNQDYDLLTIVGIGMSMMVVFHFLSSLLRGHLLLYLRTRLDLNMTLNFVEHLTQLPYAFFQTRHLGDLAMRMNSNATVREIVTSGATSAILDGTLIGFYLIVLFLASPKIASLVVVIGFLQCCLFLVLRKRQQELTSRGLETEAKSNNYQIEMLSAMETLKSMGAERRAVQHWSNLFVDSLNISIERGRLETWFDSLLGTVSLSAPLCILAYGGYLVLAGEISLGMMLAIQALAGAALYPLRALISTAMQFQVLVSYVVRIADVFDAEVEQPKGKLRAPRLQGRVEVENLSFRYSPTSPLVVKDVTLAIPPGEQVAIVGRSGSGKSTLVKLLMGLYPPTTGRVLYDDLDLVDLDVRSVRRQFGIVTQEPQLFSGTIRQNISLANPNLSMDAVVRAAKLACLHDDILEMPMGYDTPLADRGLSLSGGQRQRLSLARALAHRPGMLILDEATSSLDAITEAQIKQNLESVNCTRVIIAHRLSTVVNADLIVVMDNGEIVEQGRHSDLVSLNGHYAELVRNQFGSASKSDADIAS